MLINFIIAKPQDTWVVSQVVLQKNVKITGDTLIALHYYFLSTPNITLINDMMPPK